MCGRTCLSLTVVILSIVVFYFYHELGFGTTLRFNDQKCIAVGADRIVGSEDIAHVGAGLFIVSAGDMQNTFEGHKTHPGEMYLVDTKPDVPTSRKLTVIGLPAIPFQPHGIYLSNVTGRVYVISHGIAAGTGSRVVVFKLGPSDGADPFALTYERSVQSPLFRNGAINDVIEGVGTGELYVTEWLQYPIPAAGKRFPTKDETSDLVMLSLAPILFRGTRVFRCTFAVSGDDAAPPTCSVAADGLYSANGITRTADGATIFVNDVTAKRVHIYARDATTGALTETGRISVGYSVDNIDWAPPGVLFMGNMPVMYRVVQKMEGMDVPVPGGLSTATLTESGTWVVDDSVLMHDGSVISQVSVAYGYGGKVILGTPSGRGVLVCRL